jgi:hypothetical protein
VQRDLERILAGSQNAVAQACLDVARLLGSRAPCFQRKSAEAITASTALSTPPVVIVAGELGEVTSRFLYQLGATHAKTWPHYVLLLGADEKLAPTVLAGLALAFGHPEAGQRPAPDAVSLAEVFWESIPARSQRRLRELCDDPTALDHSAVLAVAERALRRAGLIACADVRVAVAEACAETGVADVPDDLDALAALCRVNADVSDLVQLASSAEYAQVRWQTGRAPGSGGPARGGE